jgi:hypothetical protein
MPTNQVTDAETRVQAYLDKVRSFVKHNYACELLDEPGYFATLDHGDLRALLASLATLREERDALLADKARLDWLEKFAETGAGLYAESNSDSFDWDSRKDGALRQAIDVARAAHQGTEP